MSSVTHRPIRRRGALLLAGALALAGVSSGEASAATEYGNDVSWPQCTVAQGGYGLPLPPDTAQFVVIGLTKGLPFTANPCLADQVAWASARAVPAQAYTMAGYPTAAQLSAYGAQGPWAATTLRGRLANVGYAEASYTLARLAPARFAPRMVWVDVEPRSAQPWPVGSRAREADNRAVITGLVRRLDEAGYAYGFYSNASGWQTIPGGWRTPGTPAWVTVGPRTTADAAAACAAPSFSGGPAHLAQWWDSTRDYDQTCAAYTRTPAIPYPLSGANDLNGDWTVDLLGRDRTTGTLWLYPRTAGRVRAGTDWRGMDLIDTAGDLTADGVPDVLARAGGQLWLYPRTASGGWQPRRSLGSGWNAMSAVLGTDDLDGDRLPDVLAAERTSGLLWLYPGTPAGGLGPRRQVGNGWTGFDRLLAAGDVDGDGLADVLARQTSNGALWLYRGTGSGGWRAAVRIGTGWKTFASLAAPGDLTGDGAPDVVARDPATGILWIYPTDGAGHWRSRISLGRGWNTIDLLS